MEIEPGLRVVTAPNPGIMTGAGTNQFLIGERRLTLIDAALGTSENVDLLAGELEAANATLSAILLTHIHPDHLGGVREIAARFGARLGMHSSRRGYAGLEPDRVYDEGDEIAYDGGRLRVVHTPGHESGHCCFLEPERRWLFTGDHVVGEGTVVIAPPDGDMADYVDSLRRLLALPARLLLGGHGPSIRDPRAKIREYLDHRLERERQVLARVREGLGTIPQIVEQVYRDVAPILHPIAERSVHAHLLKLEREGRVSRRGESYHPA
ncbi:MAG: MBL fold metallo-hydrolase [Candidatus Binatia bacterium]